MSPIRNKARATFDHYFDKSVDPIFDKNDFATYGLVALGVSFVLAFFTMGIKTSSGDSAVSMTIFLAGVGVFMCTAVLHFILWTLGQFYRNGVFSSLGIAGFAIGFSIAYAIAFIFGTMGGFFLALIGYSITPSIGMLTPLKVIIFAIPSIWWFSKGWRIVVEFEPFDEVFRLEIRYIKSLQANVREEFALH